MIKLPFLTIFLLLIFMSSCKNSEAIQYQVGQEWNYKTRKGEENSTLKILKIEEYPNEGKVIHISIGDLNIGNPNVENGYAKEFTHIPISEKALDESVVKLKNKKAKLPNYQDGYSYWRKEFDDGVAGIFSIPVSEIIEAMEESIITGNGVVEK